MLATVLGVLALAAPGGLHLDRATATAVTVGWHRAAGSTTQVRFRAGNAAWVRREAGRRATLTFARRAGARYRVQVRACRRGRCSRWSRTLTIAAAPTMPVTPATPTTPTTPSRTTIGGCSVFPADNPFNQDVSALPVDPRSDRYIAAIDRYGDTNLHADFGSDPTYGMPYAVVAGAAPVPVTFTEYGNESDPGPYPIPLDAPLQPASDRHALVVDSATCRLYELYHARPAGDHWEAGAGAVFDLNSNALRPEYWTSTDEAGLPVLPGLVRYDEVQAGEITHALRFTVQQTQHAFIHPATHYGSSDDPDDPPMGLRLRLRADYPLDRFHGAALVVLQALRRYGMFVADTGTSWFISGETSPRWDDADLDQLKTVPGTAFEVVQTGPIVRPPF